MPASALPWKEILRGATLAVSLAGNLIKGSSSRPKPPPQSTTQPAPDPQAQIAALAVESQQIVHTRDTGDGRLVVQCGVWPKPVVVVDKGT
jgi:hypothetical protein